MTQLREDYVAEILPSDDVNEAFARINRAWKAGLVEDFFGIESDVPTGYLLAAGGTIGDGSSGASSRANADMAELFAILWAVGNAYGSLAIYTSAGAGSTFGASAAADFAAHKRIALPDLRGRVTAGRDDMDGSDAGRIVTNETEGDKVGGVTGAEDHTLTEAQIPAHTHTFPINNTSSSTGGGGGNNVTRAVDQAANANPSTSTGTGGGLAHNNMQPTAFLNKIICTGVTW